MGLCPAILAGIVIHIHTYIYICIHDVCRESKRKTPAIVSLRNDERLFGDPAYTMVRMCVHICVFSI